MAKKKMPSKKRTKKTSRRPRQAGSKKKPITKAAAKKPSAKKKAIGAKKIARSSQPSRRIAIAKPASREPSGRRRNNDEGRTRGLAYRSGRQSGDLGGLSNVATADSESVEELIEEGQAFEGGIVRGVEHARDPDEAEVTTKEVPEDDVPLEYDDE